MILQQRLIPIVRSRSKLVSEGFFHCVFITDFSIGTSSCKLTWEQPFLRYVLCFKIWLHFLLSKAIPLVSALLYLFYWCLLCGLLCQRGADRKARGEKEGQGLHRTVDSSWTLGLRADLCLWTPSPNTCKVIQGVQPSQNRDDILKEY